MVLGVTGFALIGRGIENLTRAIQLSSHFRVAAFYHDRKYFIAFPNVSGENALAYALDMRIVAPFLGTDNETDIPSGWTEITGNIWNVAAVTKGAGETSVSPYYGDVTANGKVWQFLTGTTDAGGAIPFDWKSKAYGADAPAVQKSVSEFVVAHNSTTALTFKVYANLAGTEADSKVMPAAAAKPGEDARGKVVQVGFASSTGEVAEFMSVDWDWYPKRRAPVDG